ncbi:MAG: glycosyltransferase family 2 protein [Verrucomicrobiota bacterium]
MNWDSLALVALILAGIPAWLFLLNLIFYRRISERLAAPRAGSAISVLIPARNEEGNIAATLKSVLANRGVEFEVVVLDDHSTDRTAEIVAEIAARDSCVRLELAPPLPPGWCGKPHACHVLAQRARHDTLVLIDADVQLAPDGLQRMLGFLQTSGAALASGVPHQELGTFSERLLLPQIHFVLLGYLPLPMMRWTVRPAFSAGCGQLFVVRRDAYKAVGGHEPIRTTLHDGVKLPRLFRRHGFKTELFDATDVASCRMYRTNGEVWRGLGKNATEGLAAPGTILPMSLLLFGGQVLPFLLLIALSQMTIAGVAMTTAAVALAWLPRLIAVVRFRQPPGGALLHPIGVLALLAIQWFALARQLAGKPAVWKGRSYGAAPKPA